MNSRGLEAAIDLLLEIIDVACISSKNEIIFDFEDIEYRLSSLANVIHFYLENKNKKEKNE